MAEQIYREQVREDRTPMGPDTSLMKLFDAEAKEGVARVKGENEVYMRRYATQVQGVKDLTYKSAMQVYKNAFELLKDDPNKYEQTVANGLKDVFDAVPDSEMKQQVMAEVQISGSGYNTRVQRNQLEKQRRINNMHIRDSVFAQMDIAMDNSSVLFDALDPNASEEERLQAEKASFDAHNMAVKAAAKLNAVKEDGTPRFSASERARGKDQARNFNRYAILGYAKENIQDNRERVVEVGSYMKANKEAFTGQFGLDEESYNDTIKDLDRVVAGQTTPEDAAQASMAQADIDYSMKEMKIKNGQITNKGMNNLTDTIGIYAKLEEAEASGAYYNDPKKLSKQKGQISSLIVKQVEEGVKIKDRKLFGDNVGEVAVGRVNDNLSDIQPYLSGLGVNETEMKAAMYKDVVGGLKSQETIKLGSTDPKYKQVAKRAADGAMYKYLDGIVEVNIPEDKRKDQDYIKNTYMQALAKKDNETSVAYINRIAEGR